MKKLCFDCGAEMTAVDNNDWLCACGRIAKGPKPERRPALRRKTVTITILDIEKEDGTCAIDGRLDISPPPQAGEPPTMALLAGRMLWMGLESLSQEEPPKSEIITPPKGILHV